ncbi:hypothetical protein GGI07_002713 [Coemansia sp. Benny D115]|nr:hypothetical protein GGI07_002713 [Coemansia sp. Benny D115]
MEKEILRLYQERIDKYDEVFREVLLDIDNLRTSQRKLTQLQWDNNKLGVEVGELRADIVDMHSSLAEERKSHLEVVAENDKLRVREYELERRVRLLVNIAERYYKSLDGAVGKDTRNYRTDDTTTSTEDTPRPHKRQRSHSVSRDDSGLTRDSYEREQLAIENETLKLSIEMMRIQLQEQKANYEEMFEGLSSEFKAYRDVATKSAAEKTRKVEDLEAELARIRGLYRENLRDLVIARKTALETKHSVKQDSLLLRSEILALQRRLDAEMERSRFLQTASVPTDDFSV